MGLGLGIDIRLSDIRQVVASGVTQLIQWLLPFNLNGTAEYPTDSSGDVTSSGTSVTYARTFDATNGLVITEIAAGIPVSEGMRARENRLRRSEQFDDPVWQKQGTASITANAGADPNGNTTADRLQWSGTATRSLYQNSAKAVSNVGETATFSVWIKANSVSPGTLRLRIYSAGGGGTTYSSDITPTDTWTRYSVTASITHVTNYPSFENDSANTDAPVDVLIWGAQLEYGSTYSDYIETEGTVQQAFSNTVSNSDSTPLHPTKTIATEVDSGGTTVNQTVYLEAQDWQATTAYSLGDWVYGKNGNHNYYYECTTAGTSDASEPTWPTSSTVADGTAVWTYQGRYNNTGQVPHVLSEPAATNYALNSLSPESWTQLEGTFNASTNEITADDTNSPYIRQNSSNLAINTSYLIQYYASSGSSDWVFLYTNIDGVKSIYYNMASDTFGTQSGGGTWTSTGPPGLRKVTLAFSTDASVTQGFVQVQLAMGDGDFTGIQAGDTIKFFGCQIEGGADASHTTSIIPTTTATVTRAATVHSGTPDVSSDYLTFRVWNNTTGDQVFISDGTDKIRYSSGDIVVTDGTNSLSYTHTLAKGDIIGWDNALAKLYVNGTNVATGGAPANVSLALSGTIYVGGDSSTGSEVNGGVTDFVSGTSLDLTDITWSTP